MTEASKLKSDNILKTGPQIIEGLKKTSNKDQLRSLETEFYKRYVGYVFKVALNACMNFSDPEDYAGDITQETFINGFKAIRKFEFPKDVNPAEYENLIRGWLGKITNNFFRKLYRQRKKEHTFETESKFENDNICPVCGELLKKGDNELYCEQAHFSRGIKVLRTLKVISEDEQAMNIYRSLENNAGNQAPNKYSEKLRKALDNLTENAKIVINKYASENCISNNQHLSRGAMTDLCNTLNTTPENIRQIKKRTLDKLKKLCFSTTI